MNKPRANLLLYFLLFGLIFFLCASLFTPSSKSEIDYSTVRELFQEEKVRSFTVEDGVLTLVLREKDKNGAQTYEHALADEEMFRKELSPYYLRQADKGIIESFDFIPTEPTPWYIQLIPYFLMLLLLGAMMYFLMARASGGGAAGAAKFGRASVRAGTPERVTFADVAGADEEKAELREIVDFLRDPSKYNRLGAKIPKGVLLVGPPGTGKTLLAKAVAGEANVQFLSISGSDFVELYVGVGASRVRDLFDQAKKGAPSIVFIDEIDAVGRRRGAGLGGGNDEREQTLNQLLIEMDGFSGNSGVIIMAATNRQDVLDPALLRAGRFDRQIYVGVPDSKGREEILKVHARDKLLAEDVDLKVIARATGGFTGADLANLLNEAALASARDNAPYITMKTLEDAILKVIAGPEKRSRVRTAYELRTTAYHEAGHAVAMYFLPTQDPVHQITIVSRGKTLGMTVSLPQQDALNMTLKQMREEIVALLGGRVAEQLEFGDVSTGASNDLQRASSLARDMIARYGMSELLGAVTYDSGSEIFIGRDYERTKAYSEQTGSEIDSEVRREINEAYGRCTEILKAHYEKLRQVAEFLLVHETMSRRQFEACMKGEPIPDEAEGFFDTVTAAPAPQNTPAETADAPIEPADTDSAPAAPADTDAAVADSADGDGTAPTDTP